jgi:RNA polymerase sigma factor (TIGR02999 family)
MGVVQRFVVMGRVRQARGRPRPRRHVEIRNARAKPDMSEITALLRAAGSGDGRAADQVVSMLYGELHRLARKHLRRSGELTLLDTTALVHESYLRIQRAGATEFADRKHFLGYAAKAMRSIVIDIARARQADRRGGLALHVTLDTGVGDSVAVQQDEVLRVHEALDELADVDERLARVVEMRYFGGLSEAEIAECLGLTERTVQRDWQKARLFLSMALR